MQRPHPPFWYGAPNAEAIAWAAPLSVNVVSLGPGVRARAIADRFAEALVHGIPLRSAGAIERWQAMRTEAKRD